MVFPNPASTAVNVRFQAVESTVYSISIIDFSGRTVFSRNLNDVSGIVQSNIELGEIPNGIYLVAVYGNDGTETMKSSLVVQH